MPFALAVSLALAGCGVGSGVKQSRVKDEALTFSPRVVEIGEPVPKGGGEWKVGSPYTIAGVTYFPRHEPGYDRTGIASWYGVMFHGRKTSNGEVYDMNALTAAHPTLPMPVYARVTNLENNRSLVVRINDRGPYKKDRIIDLSQRAAELLDFKHKGTALVRVQYLGPAPLNGDDSYERMVLASQPWMLAPAQPTDATIAAATHPRPAPPMAGTGRVYVQAGLFRNETNARALAGRLSRIAPARLDAAHGEAGLIAVRLGPFNDREAALSALEAARLGGVSDARLSFD